MIHANNGAIHIPCTLREYHAMPDVWSHSQAEVLLQSPPLFYGRFISGEFPREETDALDVGTVAHAAILEPGGMDSVVAEIPQEALNSDGHRKGAAWKEWSAAHAGIIQMKAAELAPIRHMVANVNNHPRAGRLLQSPGPAEHTIVWEHAVGIKLRARLDKIAETQIGMVLCDLKTTRALSARKFAADAVQYGYHRQAAWYWSAAEAYGLSPIAFVFIVVDKSPAHECHVYQLSDRAIEYGRQQNVQLIHELAWRLQLSQWESRGRDEVFELDLPEWAYKQDQWEV